MAGQLAQVAADHAPGGKNALTSLLRERFAAERSAQDTFLEALLALDVGAFHCQEAPLEPFNTDDAWESLCQSGSGGGFARHG